MVVLAEPAGVVVDDLEPVGFPPEEADSDEAELAALESLDLESLDFELADLESADFESPDLESDLESADNLSPEGPSVALSEPFAELFTRLSLR